MDTYELSRVNEENCEEIIPHTKISQPYKLETSKSDIVAFQNVGRT